MTIDNRTLTRGQKLSLMVVLVADILLFATVLIVGLVL